MRILGITGGVGSGKSQILKYLEDNYNCRILLSDDAAKEMELPGGALFEPLVRLLSALDGERGRSVLDDKGQIDRAEMAARIFADPALLTAVNELVHPAVNQYILDEMEYERQRGKYDYFVLESALLIENGYRDIADSIWYIYCDEKVRRQRLKESRGYSDEKITSIMRGQLSDEEYRAGCDVIIDNSGPLTGPNGTFAQVDRAMQALNTRTDSTNYEI